MTTRAHWMPAVGLSPCAGADRSRRLALCFLLTARSRLHAAGPGRPTSGTSGAARLSIRGHASPRRMVCVEIAQGLCTNAHSTSRYFN